MTDIRLCSSPKEVKQFDTAELRDNFLMQNLLTSGKLSAVYSMYDRMITLGAKPAGEPIELSAMEELTKADYFLERRELGIINIGNTGTVTVDGTDYVLENKDCLYVSKGSKSVTFKSENANKEAEFIMCSSPAHAAYPTTKASKNDASEVHLGSQATCNERVIYQYIHEDGIQSCQLVMGFTFLKEGNVWNTFPPHTHLRRMEIYIYFDLPEDQMVMHYMGDPEETRHLVVRNKEAIISPEWSIHSGVGTSNYSFVWAMAGENKAFTDMDAADMSKFK